MFVAGIGLFLLATCGAIASLIVRFRRSAGAERLQLKQLVFAACLILPTMAVSAAACSNPTTLGTVVWVLPPGVTALFMSTVSSGCVSARL